MIPQILFILFLTLILVALLVPVGRYRRYNPQAYRRDIPASDEEPEPEDIGIGLTMLFFFFLLFPLLLAGSFWVGPHGPVFMGIPWVPIVVLGILLALLIAALSPREPKRGPQRTTIPEDPVVATGVAAFFGLMYFLLLFAVVVVIAVALF